MLRQHAVLPSPDARLAPSGRTAQQHAFAAAAALEAHLAMHHRTIAALVVEPLVQGAAGMAIYDPRYLEQARALCTRYGVHLIADEIMTGFGRTGTMFACEQAGIAPDFLCLSKGLTGGYLPLSVVLTTDEIYAAFYDDDVARGFLHSHSYTGNALACRAALAVLDLFRDEDVIVANRARAATLSALAQPIAAHPNVRDFRHLGMIWAFEVDSRRQDFASLVLLRGTCSASCCCVRSDARFTGCRRIACLTTRWRCSRRARWRSSHAPDAGPVAPGARSADLAAGRDGRRRTAAAGRARIRRAAHSAAAVGVYVQELGAAQPVVSHQPGRPMSPASTMKLVTTFAGLELLHPDYRWKTEAYADGNIDGGVLQGNLVLKGYGDPKITVEQFQELIARLRATGLSSDTRRSDRRSKLLRAGAVRSGRIRRRAAASVQRRARRPPGQLQERAFRVRTE